MERDEATAKKTFACSLCDSDIPVEREVKPGDIYYCSYCKVALKVIKKSDGRLVMEFEEEE